MLENYKDILTKAEVAEILRVSESTVSTWCSRCPGKLPLFFKLGDAANSAIPFSKGDVINFINEGGPMAK